MIFSIDTYTWWEASWYVIILVAITILLIKLRPRIHQRFTDPLSGKVEPGIRQTTYILNAGFIMLSYMAAGLMLLITPPALYPWAPTEINVGAAEVRLFPSEAQPDMLCYTVENQTSCLDRDEVPAEFSLNEPVLLLTLERGHIVTDVNISDEMLTERIADTLHIHNLDRINLVER